MMRVHVYVALFALLTGPLAAVSEAADTAGSADELVGLWKAKNRFGPDASSPLIIQKNGVTYTADMMGRKMPVRLDKNELTFDLPDHQGTFRGRLEAKGIRGHWLRPSTLAYFGESVSPVVLKPDGTNRWRGTVNPLQDDFTFYLLAQKRPDGLLGVVLRNPERDRGTQLGAEQRLVREGNLVKLMGKRRRQKEESEFASGSYDPERQVFTLAFPDRGRSYDFYRDNDDSDFYPRGKNPGRYIYSPPPALDDGWPTSTLDAVQIDQAGIEKAIQKVLDMPMDSAAAPQIHAILIARHGKLVLEEYFHGYHRDKLHDTRSASKSVTSVVAAAAMQAGAPLKFSSPVYQVMNGGTFPEGLEPGKRAMTLENLLNMASGIFCDDSNDQAPGNENTMWQQNEEPDFYRFYMRLPMDRVPGEKAVYCSGDANLALGVVAAATGENPLYLFERLVGGPLKINYYVWPLDPAGHPFGGGGNQFLARDFIKFGQLMLNDGMWEGRRIVSHDYVARVLVPRYRLNDSETNNYGYLWWHNDYPHENRTVHSVSPGGNGGQFVITIPALDLVIQTYNANYGNWGAATYVLTKLVPEAILPAVRAVKTTQANKKQAQQ